MTIHGNGGKLTTRQKGHLRNYGDVCYHPRTITNILALKNVREKFKVTYDGEDGSTLTVHKESGYDLKFNMHPDGLHYFDTTVKSVALVQTVKGESEGFSKKQVTQARLARQFQATVVHPSVHDLKAMVASNQIANVPISVEDIDQAQKIYGPSVTTLQGKTTRHLPKEVVSD